MMPRIRISASDGCALARLGVAAALHALTFAPGPLPGWALAPLQILALAVLARGAMRASTLRRAFGAGWWFGTVTYTVGLYWLFISMHHYGALSAPLAAAGVLALSAFLALFPAMACVLARWLWPPERSHTPVAVLRAALTWAAAWTLFEWLRATVLTGFPWLNIGYAQVDGPIAGWAPILGVHGLALVAAFAAAALGSLWLSAEQAARASSRQALAAGVAVLAVLAGWLLGRVNWSAPLGQPLSVRLVQGNVGQSQKFDPALLEEGILRHLQLANLPSPDDAASKPSLIILPETVLPLFQDQLDPSVWGAWIQTAQRQDATIAMGVPLHTQDAGGAWRYTNSVVGFDGATPLSQLQTGSTAMRYDKRHLVPWGEYVPPGFRWFVNMLQMPLGDFDRGAVRQTPFKVNDQHLAFNICYEDLFGPELLPALFPGKDGSPGATILVNVSNLGWFGDSWALRQHLQIGRLRSMETARPMLTVTNTGITAAIDAQGRVAAQLPTHQAGVLPVSVQGMTGYTPYARHGDLWVLALVGVFLIAAARKPRRRG